MESKFSTEKLLFSLSHVFKWLNILPDLFTVKMNLKHENYDVSSLIVRISLNQLPSLSIYLCFSFAFFHKHTYV